MTRVEGRPGKRVRTRVDALREAFGSKLSDEDLADVAVAVDEWEAEPGEVLVAQGHQARQGFVVLEGWATISVGAEPVARTGPGTCFWADPTASTRPAGIVADTRMWLLMLGPSALELLRRRLVVA